MVRIFLLFVTLLLSAPVAARAQTAIDRAEQLNQTLIENNEQATSFEDQKRIIQQQKSLGIDTEYQRSDVPPGGLCADINQIHIDGVTLFSDQWVRNITALYIERCLYLSDMNTIIETINAHYIDHGYVTSRAYLSTQDIPNGQLHIMVVEGPVEDIRTQNGFDRHELPSAFPGIKGEALNLRDIEQGLDQINRLQSNNATMSLEPGKTNGASIIMIENHHSDPWKIAAHIDNAGNRSTGEIQSSLGISYDNMLGVNDNLYVDIKHNLDHENNSRSRNLSARFDMPHGYWTLSYRFHYFDYVSQVNTTAQTFITEGKTRRHDISLNRLIHRDAKRKTNLKTTLEFKESENFLADIKLDSSSQKLTIANLALSHAWHISRGFVYAAITYSRGLKWFGAHADNNPTAFDPKGQFERLTADINISKLLDIALNNYNPLLEIRGHAQVSSDTLFSSERISIGGPYSVRGFKEASISGDQGAYLVTNLSVPLPELLPDDLEDTIGVIRPFIGIDIGAIAYDSKSDTEGGYVSSYSVGIKNDGGKFDYELSYSRPLFAPDFIEEESEEFFARMSLTF